MHSLACVHARHRVLAVDDDDLYLCLLEEILATENIDLALASSSRQALARAEAEAVCLVLADVGMPDLDGFELCRQLKTNPKTADTPVVLISGETDREHIDKGLSLGAADYIKKPFDRDEIRLRIRAQLRLHETLVQKVRTQNRLALISDAAKDGILFLDSQGAVAHWNAAATLLFGYPANEALGHDLGELLVAPRERESWYQEFRRFRDTAEASPTGKSVELTALRKSSEEIAVELSLSATEVGGQWFALGIVRDVTERRKNEIELRESRTQLQTVLERVPVGIALVGPDRRIRWANHTALAMIQVSSVKELSEVPCHSVLCACPGPECPVLDRAQPVERVECLLSRRDGSQLPVLKTVHDVKQGEETMLLETFVDMSSHKQLEAEVAHARKLEAVGRLAAGIAHEINTPVQYVSDSINFVREAFDGMLALLPQYRDIASVLEASGTRMDLVTRLRESEEEADVDYVEKNLGSCFDRCFDGIGRITSIVRAMKEFAHPDQREKSPADLNQALTSTLTIARNEYKYVADVDTDLGDLPPVVCHVSALNQVFLNLIVNAAHAIEEVVGKDGSRGTIRIVTRTEGDTVRIEIGDTGVGIPERILHQIYDPFFTTKPVGKGSGQGLAIARSVIVDKHGGTLSCQSEVGHGTTFIIRLPVNSGGNGVSRTADEAGSGVG